MQFYTAEKWNEVTAQNIIFEDWSLPSRNKGSTGSRWRASGTPREHLSFIQVVVFSGRWIDRSCTCLVVPWQLWASEYKAQSRWSGALGINDRGHVTVIRKSEILWRFWTHEEQFGKQALFHHYSPFCLKRPYEQIEARPASQSECVTLHQRHYGCR